MTEAEPIHPGLPVLYDRDAPYVDPEAQTVRLVSYTGRDYVNVLYSGLNGVEDASFDDDSDETRKLRNFVADVRQLGAYVGQNLVLNEAVNLPHPERLGTLAQNLRDLRGGSELGATAVGLQRNALASLLRAHATAPPNSRGIGGEATSARAVLNFLDAVLAANPEGVILDPQTDAYLSQMGVAYTDAFPSVR
jgi:hypothetical protein